jgi:hypothetical protein
VAALQQLDYTGSVDILAKVRGADIRDQLVVIYDRYSKSVDILAAVKQLAELKATEVRDNLLPLLEHKDKDVRLGSVAALQQLDYTGSVDILAKVRGADIRDQLVVIHDRYSKSSDILAAVKQLAELKAVEACDNLLPLLEHDDKDIRSTALEVLKGLNYSGPVNIDATYRNMEIRVSVMHNIQVVERSSDLREVMEYIKFLGNFGDSKASLAISQCIKRTTDSHTSCVCFGCFWCADDGIKDAVIKAKEAINSIQANSEKKVESSVEMRIAVA